MVLSFSRLDYWKEGSEKLECFDDRDFMRTFTSKIAISPKRIERALETGKQSAGGITDER